MSNLGILNQARKDSDSEESFIGRYNELFYEKYKDADQIICSTETGEPIGALYINMVCKAYQAKELKRFFTKLVTEMEEDSL